MNTSDVVKQLQAVLPKYSDIFSSAVDISSLTASGTLATAVCKSAHSLKSGDFALIKGARMLTGITITAAGGVATAHCGSAHDLTMEDGAVCQIVNADQAQFNGSHALLSVPDAYSFTYQVDVDAPAAATGSPALSEARAGTYNGRYAVTVVDAKVFTYQLAAAYPSPASGDIKAVTGIRITGVATEEQIEKIYTAQDKNCAWLFVVNGDAQASQDRQLKNDGVYVANPAQGYFQNCLFSLPLVVVMPATGEIGGRAASDVMTDVRRALFKSLLGVKFDSGLSDGINCGVCYVNDMTAGYTGAVYFHRFNFQQLFQIGLDDVCDAGDSVAFRGITLNDSGLPRTISGNLP